MARNSDRDSTIVYNVLGLADGAEKAVKTERCHLGHLGITMLKGLAAMVARLALVYGTSEHFSNCSQANRFSLLIEHLTLGIYSCS